MLNMPGGPEIAVILVIALLVLGPQQLPKAMRTLGNAMAEIRKVSNSFQAEMRSAMDSLETQGTEKPSPSPERSSTQSPSTATEANELPEVTEVVARNPEPPTGDEQPPERGEGPPAIDPADRAAG